MLESFRICSVFSRAVDKREYLVIIRDNFCYFFLKTYVVTPHLNRLDETVQMRGHNIRFHLVKKNYPELSSNTPLRELWYWLLC